MKYWAQIIPAPGFTVVDTAGHSQAATLVLPPDERTDESDNAHPGADQWLYVLGGTGRVAIDDRSEQLGPGTVILIEAGEPHAISNMGDTPLEILYIYSPVIYPIDQN